MILKLNFITVKILCILAFSSLLHSAQSQIVNVESKRSDNSQEAWHGSLNLSLNFTRNTDDVLDYGAKGTVQYLKQRHRLLVLSDLSRVVAGGTDFINKGYEHVRYNYDFGNKRHFSFEAFQQAQFNGIQRIDFRHLTGAGLRWNILENDSLKLWVGSLPMYEYEKLTTGIIERNFRQSSYVLFFVAFKKFEFQTINYYQPRLDYLSDFRFSSSNSIEFGVLSWLRFVTSLDLTYDSAPPAEVPDLVFTFRNAIKLEF